MNDKNQYSQSQLRTLYGSEGALHLTILIIVLVGVLIIASASLIVLYKKIPEPKYFAVTNDHKFFSLPSENEPSLSQGLLQNWVSTFALASHTFDFYHFDQQMSVMEKYFTPEGYREYLLSIQGFREEILQKQMMLSCIVLEAPSIRRSTVIDNIYEWYVEVPVLIRYDSASSSRNESRKLILVIKRYNSNVQNPYGVAVSMFRSVRE